MIPHSMQRINHNRVGKIWGGAVYVTVQMSTKVVGIMRQNACLLAFCVQNLLSFTPQ